MTSTMPAPSFDASGTVDLIVDAIYRGGRAGNSGDDAITRLVPVGNMGGFRYAGSPRSDMVRLISLSWSGRDPDWPDSLDEQTGVFTYYGDNKNPGRELHDTDRQGNALLRDVFTRAHGTVEDRRRIPPFLLFSATGEWRDVRFRGLLAPGTPSATSDDDLQAIWRSKNGLRFQNYRALFTVLDVPSISRKWIDEIVAGNPHGQNCPRAWQQWIGGRAYVPLLAETTTVVRSRVRQLPSDRDGSAILATIVDWFRDYPHAFEACAAEIWRMIAPASGPIDLTPPSRDGGRDAMGRYLLGPKSDQVSLDFVLEAKCYSPTNSVGVRELSRLISRLRHRMFGVLVTTSYIHHQAYGEVRADGHPVVLIAGADIVDILRSHGYTTRSLVLTWLDQRFPRHARTPSNGASGDDDNHGQR